MYPRCTILSTALGILDQILHGRIQLNYRFLCYLHVLSTDSTICWLRLPATALTAALVTSRAVMMHALSDGATTAPLPVSDHDSSRCQDAVFIAAVPWFSGATRGQLRRRDVATTPPTARTLCSLRTCHRRPRWCGSATVVRLRPCLPSGCAPSCWAAAALGNTITATPLGRNCDSACCWDAASIRRLKH